MKRFAPKKFELWNLRPTHFLLYWDRYVYCYDLATKRDFDVVAATIKDFLKKPLSQEEVEEYKNIYETAYFLTLEEHSSLCNALGSHLIYKNEIDSFYDFPKQLEKINAEALHALAKNLLKDFRMGVVYNKSKFEPKWSLDFLISSKICLTLAALISANKIDLTGS